MNLMPMVAPQAFLPQQQQHAAPHVAPTSRKKAKKTPSASPSEGAARAETPRPAGAPQPAQTQRPLTKECACQTELTGPVEKAGADQDAGQAAPRCHASRALAKIARSLPTRAPPPLAKSICSDSIPAPV